MFEMQLCTQARPSVPTLPPPQGGGVAVHKPGGGGGPSLGARPGLRLWVVGTAAGVHHLSLRPFLEPPSGSIV